jgi:hypothetical protein
VVEGTFQDCRFALRTFRRSLGFTALLRLGLGIRGNTAVLSVIDGVLLHPIPFPDSNRLVALYQKTPRDQKNAISVSQFLGLAAVNATFEGIAGVLNASFTLTGTENRSSSWA